MECRSAIAFSLLAVMVSWASAAQPDCSKEIGQLQPCLAYVEGQVNIPSSECCTGLTSVHVKRPVCLCILMSSTSNTPGVNSTSATLLPQICKVDTDPKRCPELLKGGDQPSPSGSSSSSTGKAADESSPKASSSSSMLPSFVVVLLSLASYVYSL